MDATGEKGRGRRCERRKRLKKTPKEHSRVEQQRTTNKTKMKQKQGESVVAGEGYSNRKKIEKCKEGGKEEKNKNSSRGRGSVEKTPHRQTERAKGYNSTKKKEEKNGTRENLAYGHRKQKHKTRKKYSL
jgi:hypothetical protein